MQPASRLKIIIAVLTVTAGTVCAVTWYYASPGWTVNRMKEAAAANDPDGVSAYVDYPMVRDNMKADYKATVVKGAVASDAPASEMMGSAVAFQMMDTVIDNLISQETIRQMFDVRQALKSSRMPFGLSAARAELVRDSFSQFRLRNPNGGALVFERRGFGWKLIAFRSAIGQENNLAKLAAPSAPDPAPEDENAVPFTDATGQNSATDAASRPVVTAAWLMGSWGPLREDTPDGRLNACETDSGVIFQAGGKFQESEAHGRFRTDGNSITYYNRIITSYGSDGEDRSEFENVDTNPVEAIDADTLRESGQLFARCSDPAGE